MSFKIGSINMYKFSHQKDKEISKDISRIAKVIREEEFDIVALQEVFNEAAIKDKLLEELQPGWDYIWKAPVSRSLQAAEGYAFIWNKRRFRLATGMKKEEKKYDIFDDVAHRKFMPRIHSQYNPDDALFAGKLIRDPLYARFESVYGWYELRLINTHIIYRDIRNEDSERDKLKRKRELDVLIDICHQISNKKYRNDRTAYTFLLGDYNLSLKDIDPTSLDVQKAEKTLIDRNGKEVKIITVQHELSTLKLRQKEESDNIEDGYANNYDHFTFEEKMITDRRVNLSTERINTVEKYWDSDFAAHRKEFSDHVPIKLIGEF